MPDFVWAVIAGVPCLIIGILAGYFYRKNATEKRIGRAEETAARIVEEAKTVRSCCQRNAYPRQRTRSIVSGASATESARKDGQRFLKTRKDLLHGKSSWRKNSMLWMPGRITARAGRRS